jgi:hypothetical protein
MHMRRLFFVKILRFCSVFEQKLRFGTQWVPNLKKKRIENCRVFGGNDYDFI